MSPLQHLFKFNGGVKPAYNKEASTGLPIAVAPRMPASAPSATWAVPRTE